MLKRRLRPAPRLSGQEFAAIDLGSNSFHMLVARMSGGELQVIDRLREPVRLAEGLDGGGSRNLRTDVAQRALNCLRRFGERLRGIPAAHVRAVGTNTMRKLAANSGFHAEAEAALGHSIEIIAGLEEARLVYRGVIHGRGRAHPRRLVVDIGGGSTELIIGRGEEPRLMESVSLGCVVHTRKFFEDGRISEARFKRARLAAGVELEFLQQPYRKAGWDVAIGSSGTIRGIWRVMKEQGWSDEHLTREGLEQVIALALKRKDIGDIDFPGLREDRRPVFIGGLAVLAGVFDTLDIRRMETSDRALREGLLYDLIGRLSDHDVREQAVASMAERYGVDLVQAENLERTALQILDQVGEAWDLEPHLAGQFLRWAARLHEVGLVITHNGYHKHGEYIVRHSDLAGFSQTDQKALAALVRLHRGKFAAGALAELPQNWVEPLRYLAMILRLAYLLHRSRAADLKPPLRVQATRRTLDLQFTRKHWLDEHPLTRADLEREAAHLETLPMKLRLA
ncbi:exopolyphosphatase / guanosine-5'-triphosphate,3'-diphosphate pyrophosphatase [Solimonas aquatica]|uniref:Exopolyphosphatase / guanosine-5'-triphosphate,3'-diphosphate pyrophosphatase n=1 Tax=Solimonas aquatica TaxID=489703 RepID=A0A1H9EW24_9GAMM|nr:Ppx/GppA phosphatase family protein [Solimonas aquatica]SEQ29443.1 exopolyphosphatase / guanosine-5'-triphosphate,3'-diphosphate pyrophosphatase [Solimonas aquatica]